MNCPLFPASAISPLVKSASSAQSSPMCCATGSRNFPSLKPVKRRGNRRYYQRDDVLTIRQIRSLLYDQGYTIGGARQRMTDEDGEG